jgi:hypothetical protein
VRAAFYFDKERSGLDARAMWNGRVFLNPPGGLVRDFWRRLEAEVTFRRTTQAVWIGYSLEQIQTLQTDGRGPASLASAICYPRARMKFDVSELERARLQAVLDAKLAAEGKPSRRWTNSPTHANFIAYIGPSPDRFADLFGAFGEVR